MDQTGKNTSDPGQAHRPDGGAGTGKPNPATNVAARFAPLPDPPYYTVIFANQRSSQDEAGYGAMAEMMDRLAHAHPGCIGLEASRDADGFGITVSYWRDEAALLDWRNDARHLVGQQLGKKSWYSHYRLRVAKVERAYSGPEGR